MTPIMKVYTRKKKGEYQGLGNKKSEDQEMGNCQEIMNWVGVIVENMKGWVEITIIISRNKVEAFSGIVTIVLL